MYATGGNALCMKLRWVQAYSDASPGWSVKAHHIPNSNHVPGVDSSTDQASMGCLWQEYFTDRTQWLEDASIKLCRKPSTLEHRRTKETWKARKSVKESFQSGSPFYGARRVGQKLGQEEGVEMTLKFISWLKACRDLESGRKVHADLIRSGVEFPIHVTNTLMDMYVKCGSIVDAHHVFSNMIDCSVVSWNVMILGYANPEEGEVALGLYARMQQAGVTPNARTFVGVLKACSSLATLEEGTEVDGKLVKVECLEKGKSIHSRVVKGGFQSNVFVGTTLVDMYAKCGSMVEARQVFDRLPNHDVISWTAMILGYADQGDSEESFKLYAQMQEQGLSADSSTYVSMLKACGKTAALETGKEIHAQICRVGLETSDIMVATTLIDMYGKCGSMVDAQQVFDALPSRNVVTWSALIAGYARQAESDHVFHLFERMKLQGIQPNGVTYLSVLTVCSHAGLVDKGQEYFNAMKKDYNVTPTVEHYNCLVDLLGRAGHINKALSLVETMPFEPDLITWTIILSACQKWKNVEIGRHAFECAVKLDERCAAIYMLMSNIYSDAHMWEDRDMIQSMRGNAQAWKKPGQTLLIQIGGMVHTFLVADRNHVRSKDIYSKLHDFSIKIKEEGYVHHLRSVLKDMSDDVS